MSKPRVIDRDLGWRQWSANFRKLSKLPKSAGAYVGVLEDAGTYDNGEEVAVVAATNEFGSPAQGIPERSFLRSTVDKNEGPYLKGLVEVAERATRLGISDPVGALREGLSDLGEVVAADVVVTIDNFSDPGNASATIEKKGGVDDPLVDTGHMRDSLRAEVRGV